MASSYHQSYCFKDQDPLGQDYSQGFSSLEVPAQLPLYSGQGPFLQAPTSDFAANSNLDQEEQQQQVVVASNDLPVSDMDLANFLEMDDKTLSELTGVNSTEWNSLFNGQLDDVSSLDPMTGVQNPIQPDHGMVSPSSHSTCMNIGCQPPQIDRWLIEETQKLERQQKIQQQKLMELQQTLLKTEILKNQLQIATISSQAALSPTMSTTSSLLLDGCGASQQGPPTNTRHNDGGDSGAKSDLSPNPGAGRAAASPMFASSQSSLRAKASAASSMTVAGSVTSRGGRMSTLSNALSQSNSSDFFTDIDVKPTLPDIKPAFDSSFPMLESPPPSPPTSGPNSPGEEPCKRKVHNLIEKKYRCSINDRIGLLRQMVSRHCKDSKKLQKSAVLQKTIDFIHHLQNTIKKLQEENRQLRETLAMTTEKTHLPSFSSPPNTPDEAPSSSESEIDSGHPSSPDESDGQLSHGASPTSRTALFNQFLHNPIRHNSASQYLMVVMLVAVFFVNPFSLSGPGSVARMMGGQHTGGAGRSLSAIEMDTAGESNHSMNTLAFVGVWALRVLVAALCFGWMTLKSIPKVMANSQDSVQFWRLRKQAEKDVEKGEFMTAKDNLEAALSVINRPIPISYLGMISGLLWSLFSHLLFQLVIGRYAVYLATMFIRHKAEKDGTFNSPKKQVFGVTFDAVSETYHLLHQINLASTNPPRLNGIGFFLALNALNFAEADRPFNRLSEQRLAEMYFAIGIQCYYSFSYGSTIPMWYYFFCFQSMSPSKYATPLKWAVTEPGKSYLMSAKWASDVTIASRLYVGNAALPSFSITRAYCKELLCETLGYVLLPDDSPDSKASRDSEATLQAFKLTLNLAKEANSCLLNDESNIKGAAGCSDSGFTVIQWWASVGIVSYYWLAGKESLAEDYYPNIESLSGEMGAAVPSALQLAFKANRMYKRPSNGTNTSAPVTTTNKVPLDVVLQLCNTTSTSLEGSVANLLQDCSNSTETELHQLGLLQACDWLLGLKVALWENHENENGISQEICPGFYQDLETLSKLVTLLPSARSRLHLYKGCYQLIAGANPIAAQAMLNSTGSASLIRRRTGTKDENPALCSHEHAMAQVMAYKHLPPSMELPHATPPLSPAAERTFTPLAAHTTI